MALYYDPNTSEYESKKRDLNDVNYDYAYPPSLDLKPGSKLHTKLVEFVMKRATEARHNMEGRYDSWRQIDRTLTAYVRPEDADAAKKINVSAPVIVPTSFATLETLLTYMTATFLQDPIFQYSGVGPEDTVGAILLEKVVHSQCVKSKVGLQLHTQFRDAFSYGFGVTSPVWDTKYGNRVTKGESGFISNITNMFKATGETRMVTDGLIFEGNKLDNIDPYLYLPDPNVPIHDIQNAEYVGWISKENLMTIMEDEKGDEDMFNARYLKHISGGSALTRTKDDDRGRTQAGESFFGSNETNPVDVIYMYVNIIPSDLDLGDSEYPEKWLFIVAADHVVLKAQPLGLNHNMFPVAVASPDFDGYSSSPVSRMEVIYGLQETMDWLFSSHVANVKKAINDMLIVDPSLVNINDLRNPGPGRLLRLRRTAWGRGVEGAVKQLPVSDVTRSHISDTTYIQDIIQRVSAASDSLQGIMKTSGERRSATEARDSRTGALSRIEKSARLMSMQSMQDIGYMFASHTQQLMSEDTYVDLTGKWEDVLKSEYGSDMSRIKVSPLDLAIDFDIQSHDGSSPGGEPSDLWVQLYQTLAQNSEVSQQFDMFRIFKHIARQMGAKNVDDFVKKSEGMPMQPPQVQSDESVMQEADRGNLVPMGGR